MLEEEPKRRFISVAEVRKQLGRTSSVSLEVDEAPNIPLSTSTELVLAPKPGQLGDINALRDHTRAAVASRALGAFREER